MCQSKMIIRQHCISGNSHSDKHLCHVRECTNQAQACREPQRGPGKYYRGALSPPHSVCLEIEAGNVGRGVPSPSD